jgi:hypothetical protein
VLVIYSQQLLAQVTDSLQAPNNNAFVSKDTTLSKSEKKKIYSGPRRATLLSAVLPGLGQAYNKKYWKIPLIYAGFGGLGYMFVVNNNQYNYYRSNLVAENDADSTTLNLTRYNSDQLQQQKIYYRKNRDFAAIGIALVYLFNVIDANVDAHLTTFDVSDDLSIRVDPWQNIYRTASGYGTAAGISLKISFN